MKPDRQNRTTGTKAGKNSIFRAVSLLHTGILTVCTYILAVTLCVVPATSAQTGTHQKRGVEATDEPHRNGQPEPIQAKPEAVRQDTAQLALPATALLGEGAIWHPGRHSLLWVDIEGKTLHEYLPASTAESAPAPIAPSPSITSPSLAVGTSTPSPSPSKSPCPSPFTPAEAKTSIPTPQAVTAATDACTTRSWHFDRMVSTVVPETDSTAIVALQNAIVRINLNTDAREELASIDDRGGYIRCNDGKCDPSGRLWIGTMAFAGTPGAGTLYCLAPDGSLTAKLDSVTISNGIVWSADRRTMYYIDTPTRRVARYRYDDPSGTIRFDGIAVDVPQEYGFPDGMTIDAQGNLWIALWGGFGVGCWDPHTGQLLQRIAVPCPNATSCAFGGENLDTLYITTAGGAPGSELRQRYPMGGSLFVFKPGVSGVKPLFFSKKN